MQILEILKRVEDRRTEMSDFTNSRNLTKISKKTARDQCHIWSKEGDRGGRTDKGPVWSIIGSLDSNKLWMTTNEW